MKNFEFKQLSREQLKKVKGGAQSALVPMCGYIAGGASCAPGYCCSRYGYCGTDAPFCGEGCQPEFGDCW